MSRIRGARRARVTPSPAAGIEAPDDVSGRRVECDEAAVEGREVDPPVADHRRELEQGAAVERPSPPERGAETGDGTERCAPGRTRMSAMRRLVRIRPGAARSSRHELHGRRAADRGRSVAPTRRRRRRTGPGEASTTAAATSFRRVTAASSVQMFCIMGRDDGPQGRAAEVHHAGGEHLRAVARRVVGHLRALAGPKIPGIRASTRVPGGESVVGASTSIPYTPKRAPSWRSVPRRARAPAQRRSR